MVAPDLQIVHSTALKSPMEACAEYEQLLVSPGYNVVFSAPLHIDEVPEEKCLRIGVLEKIGGLLLPGLRQKNVQGATKTQFPYGSAHFRVMTTNGIDTTQWRVDRAYGDYEGPLDGIVHPYSPEREKLALSLSSPLGSTATLEFRRTAEGILLSNGLSAWVVQALPPTASGALQAAA